MAIAMLFIGIEVILFYNATYKEEDALPAIFPFIAVIIALLALGYSLNISLKATNSIALNEFINDRLTQERARMMKEFEKKEEQEININLNELLESKINSIIPKGNFKNIDALLEKYLKNLANEIGVVQGIIYIKNEKTNDYKFAVGFALTSDKKIPGFKAGETLPGQVAITHEICYINEIPDKYFEVESGLGKAAPKQLVFAPVVLNDKVLAILELAFFKAIEGLHKDILLQSLKEISLKVEQTIKS
jgi:two-component system chemotaxis sensor kinase CheA